MNPQAVDSAIVARRTIIVYIGWFVLFFLLLCLPLRIDPTFGSVTGQMFSAAGKLRYYRGHASDYDLVFAGDSRTYCGMQTCVFDEMLGTNSFNLSIWAHWFPTQYPSFQTLLTSLPKDTVVVWSIGHNNFKPVHDTVNASYPIGLTNLSRYLLWGYPPSALTDNLISGLPGTELYQQRGVMQSSLAYLFKVPAVGQRPAPAPDPNLAVLKLRAQAACDPHVLLSIPIRDQDRTTSVALIMDRGYYTRVEIDHGFFRAKQEEEARELRTPVEDKFAADPAYFATFLGVLELFQQAHVRLVVNEIGEAPFHYRDEKNRRLCHDFMQNVVRAEVEKRGIPYIRANLEAFTDSEYFDYNHLNSEGAPRYSQMVAQELRPILSRWRGPRP